MNEKLHELRQQYFNLSLSVEPEEILSILDGCTSEELHIIKDIILTTKTALNKYR